MRLVAAAGMRGASLTDHDTIDGVTEAEQEARRLGIDFISGIEISAGDGAREVHILGYGIDLDHEALVDHQRQTFDRRYNRVVAMIERLRELGHRISLADTLERIGDGMPGRPHLARAMVDAGIVTSVRDAFHLYLSARGQAFIPKAVLRVDEAIALIHRTGGAAVLAHPGQAFTDHEIGELAGMGLDGVEASHPSHSNDLTEYYQRVAARFGLISTGGSDYHGRYEEESLIIGRHGVDSSVIDALRRRAGA